jgi:protein-tyrosine phosphatase
VADPEAQTAPKPLLKRVLRPLVPERLLKDREIYLRLGKKTGNTYLRLRALDALGVRGSNKRKVPADAQSFVFVCFGNIMRSPMAELMFRRTLAEHGEYNMEICSAGIHAIPGSEAHPRSQIAGRELGLPLDYHRSKLLTAEMVEQADAIFAMDFQNKAELLNLYPEASNKIFMLSAYGEGKYRYREIPDPFFGDQDEARRCYAVLQTCIHNLVKSLRPIAKNAVAAGVR